MMKNLSPRDWESLSAYLDGQLAPGERTRLEKKLQASADLRVALDELRRTRAVLRSQPRLRAPRNFTLTPEMAGLKRPGRAPAGWIPALSWASALAGLLFVVVLLGDLLLGGTAASPTTVALRVATEAPAAAVLATAAPALQSMKQAAPVTEAPAAAAPAVAQAPAAAPESLPASPTGQPTGVRGVAPAPTNTGTEQPPSAGAAAIMASTEAANAQEAHAVTETPSAGSLAASPDQAGVATPAQESYLQETPTSPIPAPTEATSLTYEAPAEDLRQPGFWTPWRKIETALAAITLLAGLGALLLRRSGR